MRFNTFSKLMTAPLVAAALVVSAGLASAQNEDETQQESAKSKKSAGTARYLQLNLLNWKQVRGETEVKTSSTNKTPSNNTSYGLDQTDTLEVGVFGSSAFITAGIEKPTDYTLAVGWKSSMLMAGLELGFASTTSETTTFVNGAELKTKTNTANSNYGVVVGYLLVEKSFMTIIKGRFGLTGADSDVDNSQTKTVTSDISGTYFGLGLDYSSKYSAFGPNVSIAHGLDYLYSSSANKNPVDGTNRDTGESKTTSHTWSVNLAALRLHF